MKLLAWSEFVFEKKVMNIPCGADKSTTLTSIGLFTVTVCFRFLSLLSTNIFSTSWHSYFHEFRFTSFRFPLLSDSHQVESKEQEKCCFKYNASLHLVNVRLHWNTADFSEVMLIRLCQEYSHLQMDCTVEVVPPLGVPPPWALASLDIMWAALDPLEIPLVVKPDEWVEPLAPGTVTKKMLLTGRNVVR